MGMLKLIEWKDQDKDVIVHRYDFDNDYITRGSKLTVRESQAVVFCDKGKMADVFLPGFYTLNTDNVPLLTKIMSWKYGFQSPFKSDVYFVNTKQFTNQKWGTSNPILIKDAEFGVVRVRAFGTYSFKVKDPYIFMSELSSTNSTFTTKDITDYLRSQIVTRISDIMGEAKISVTEMTANLIEMGELVQRELQPSFAKIGVMLCSFNFENVSLPETIEKAIDESASLGILGKNMNVYMQKAQAEAMINVAKNPGMAGTTMGAGIGMGLGMNMGNMFNNMSGQASGQIKCPTCGKYVVAGSNFCSECGGKIIASCSKCGKTLTPGSKFCPDCGTRV